VGLLPFVGTSPALHLLLENKMKFRLFVAVIAALFFHSEINEFVNGSAKPLPAEQQARVDAQKGVVGAPHSNSPAVLPMPPALASAAAPTTPVIVGKEEDGWITKWFIEHTPKK
jgi:hypothetical protein